MTFTAPTSGASGTFASSGSNTVTVGADVSGNASAAFGANDLAGTYTLVASSAYGSVDFTLTNTAAGHRRHDHAAGARSTGPPRSTTPTPRRCRWSCSTPTATRSKGASVELLARIERRRERLEWLGLADARRHLRRRLRDGDGVDRRRRVLRPRRPSPPTASPDRSVRPPRPRASPSPRPSSSTTSPERRRASSWSGSAHRSATARRPLCEAPRGRGARSASGQPLAGRDRHLHARLRAAAAAAQAAPPWPGRASSAGARRRPRRPAPVAAQPRRSSSPTAALARSTPTTIVPGVAAPLELSLDNLARRRRRSTSSALQPRGATVDQRYRRPLEVKVLGPGGVPGPGLDGDLRARLERRAEPAVPAARRPPGRASSTGAPRRPRRRAPTGIADLAVLHRQRHAGRVHRHRGRRRGDEPRQASRSTTSPAGRPRWPRTRRGPTRRLPSATTIASRSRSRVLGGNGKPMQGATVTFTLGSAGDGGGAARGSSAGASFVGGSASSDRDDRRRRAGRLAGLRRQHGRRRLQRDRHASGSTRVASFALR